MVIPSPRPQKRARIEIIPLIDIMFFLLATFLMVSLSMIKNNGLSVRLPTAEGSKAQPKEDATTITITADGSVFVNKEGVSPDELKAKLAALKQSTAEPRVRIQGDERASLGAAVGVLDIARGLGIERISIVTKPVATQP
jgi:biopolymer transport protein ExbD